MLNLAQRRKIITMETLVLVIHYIASLFIIVVVLVQGGNQGGIGAAFGGGNSQGVFGASGATSFLGKLTYVMGAVLLFSTISLTIIQGKGGDVGLSDKLQKANIERVNVENEQEDQADKSGDLNKSQDVKEDSK